MFCTTVYQPLVLFMATGEETVTSYFYTGENGSVRGQRISLRPQTVVSGESLSPRTVS